MQIVVLAGSPKAENSVTMQYVRYLERRLPEHTWHVEHVAARIKKLDRVPAAFDDVIDHVRSADLVLWSFPLYVGLVHSGLKRFVELVHERDAGAAFAGKHAASLSTSIHFYDHIAHDYVRAVAEDLEMRFVDRFSAAMRDLLQPEQQRQLETFGRSLVTAVEQDLPTPRLFAPLAPHAWRYEPGPVDRPADPGARRVLILHDARPDQHNLRAMVDRLERSFTGDVTVRNLRDVAIKGHCLGCLRCGQDYRCAYTGKDEFVDFYDEQVRTADVLVFAGAVVDRHLSSRWRLYFERKFKNTHTPTLKGKQLAFAVAGPLGQMANLREMLFGYSQWQECNLVGMVSDEVGDAVQLDAQLTALAGRMAAAAEAGYQAPPMFHHVGGVKIFRDEIFGSLRMVFQADHRYYARNGYYDFPTGAWGLRLLGAALSLLFRWPRARREFEKNMRRGGMTRRLAQVVAQAGPAPEPGSADRSVPAAARPTGAGASAA